LSGTSTDDHPHADIRNGQAFLNQVYTAIATSPNWENTVFVINYDEWGGFFEHVPPSVGPIPLADQGVGSDGLRGFRVPCIVASPFARRAYISGTEFDHTSVLKMIEWRWNLEPLTVRDEQANNLAEVLDFKAKNQSPTLFSVPPGPFGGACPNASVVSGAGRESAARNAGSEIDTWLDLRDSARLFGWPV